MQVACGVSCLKGLRHPSLDWRSGDLVGFVCHAMGDLTAPLHRLDRVAGAKGGWYEPP